MDLKTFIEETISEILDGVKATQEKYKTEQSGMVVPMYASYPDAKGHGKGQLVDFDVAVTTSDGKEGSAGLKVLGVGAKGTMSESSNTVSRIKFKIPIALPCNE